MQNKFTFKNQTYTIKSRPRKTTTLMYLVDENGQQVKKQRKLMREYIGKLTLPESDCEMSTYEYFAYILGKLNN